LIQWIKEVLVSQPIDYLFVDIVGLGGGVYDVLKRDLDGICEMRIFNGGSNARNQRIYFNLRSECWHMLKDWLKDHGSIPNKSKLRTELTTQEYRYRTDGRKIMLSKDEAKSKGIPSPNMGDAINMTFAPLVIAERPKLEQSKPKRKVGFYG